LKDEINRKILIKKTCKNDKKKQQKMRIKFDRKNPRKMQFNEKQ
jgi:hypothetical protein